MEKEKILQWIERICKVEKKERNAIVAEMAKQNGLKEKDAYKLLRENGFNPNEIPQANKQGDSQDPPQANKQGDSKRITVMLKHKTEYPAYRRAGLVLTQKAQPFDVTEDQLEKLKADPWVVVGGEKEDGKDK